MPVSSTTALVWLALPIATAWVKKQQAHILRVGEPLTAAQMMAASKLGVQYPERVRIRYVPSVPMPLSSTWIGRGLSHWNIMPADVAGMALGYGIHLHYAWGKHPEVLQHELVHVGQYERLGGIKPFLKAYLYECLAEGYPNGALEREALVRGQGLNDDDSSGLGQMV